VGKAGKRAKITLGAKGKKNSLEMAYYRQDYTGSLGEIKKKVGRKPGTQFQHREKGGSTARVRLLVVGKGGEGKYVGR